LQADHIKIYTIFPLQLYLTLLNPELSPVKNERVPEMPTLKNSVGAQLSFLFVSSFSSLPLFPPLPLATAKGVGGALNLPQWVWAEPGHQTIVGAFGAENASGECSFSAVYEIIASARKT